MLLVAEDRDDHDVGLEMARGGLADQIDAAAVGQAQVGQEHIRDHALQSAARRGEVTHRRQERQLLSLADDAAEPRQEGRIVLYNHHGRIRHEAPPWSRIFGNGSGRHLVWHHAIT